MTLSLCCADGAKLTPCGRTYPRFLEPDPDTDLLDCDPLDWLDSDDTPDTDRFSEKHEDMGVGSRFGDEEVEASGTVTAGSRSADIVRCWQFSNRRPM